VIRAVIDTNVLVSAAIKPRGEAGRILTHLRNDHFTLLYSMTLLEELVDVLNRPRLRDKYHLTAHYIHFFLHLIRLRGEKIEPTRQVTACRDPHDDMFLEVALSGEADLIISKDDDLLVLSPFEGVTIMTPPLFLAQLNQQTRS
jgi:uncharacterized protein